MPHRVADAGAGIGARGGLRLDGSGAAAYRRPMGWFVYLIECRDGAIYTGIAIDVDARYAAHVAGKGARYTRANPPERLLARIAYPDRAAASRAEYAIKKLKPAKKRALAADARLAAVMVTARATNG